ncbi:MAG: hypothetical protein ABR501_15445, partial [Pyrinomonadaceae bacterium]
SIPLRLGRRENGGDATVAASALTNERSRAKATRASAQCASEIVLAREVAGVRTAVRFGDGRITAPVAFRGSYEAAPLGCIR